MKNIGNSAIVRDFCWTFKKTKIANVKIQLISTRQDKGNKSNMANLPVIGLVSHTRKVTSLYKKALRCLESWYDRREVYRYYAVLMRQRFEEKRDIHDMRIAKDLLLKGEEELFQKQHWLPRRFPESPGGVAYEREVQPPDWVLDYWHPLEKAQYPEYFARRELRKKEFVQNWEKKYGKSKAVSHH